MKKDTIYIDIEDDITSIIDKVKGAKSNIVALIPPKRSTALNSAVNMKLLLRAANEAGKRVVLVTSEQSLVGLAGGVGAHVADNLHAKPYIPKTSDSPLEDDAVIDGNELDPSASIGELASVQSASSSAGSGKTPSKSSSKPAGRSFGLKIPSFERFRSRLFLISAAILLLAVGWWWAFWLAPQATIAIQAQTSRIDTDFEFTASTAEEDNDFERNVFAAEEIEITRDANQDFEPTGSKNVGEKASGSITVRNCEYADEFTLPAGTTFEANGLRYESLEAIVVDKFTGGASDCDLDDSSEAGEGSGTIRAAKPGDQYNLAPTDYSFASNDPGGNVDALGGQMSGGTTEKVTVVTKQDVNEARDELGNTDDESEMLDELKIQAGEGMIVIDETYRTRLTDVTSRPAVGEEASNATLTATIHFTVLAIERETLTTAVEDFQQAAIDGGNQRIYDNGMDQLIFDLLERDGPVAEIGLSTDGYVGPELDTGQLARDVAGKRYSEVVETVRSRPGVIDVTVDFSPFWVFSAPKAEKIDISFDIQDSSSDSDQTQDE